MSNREPSATVVDPGVLAAVDYRAKQTAKLRRIFKLPSALQGTGFGEVDIAAKEHFDPRSNAYCDFARYIGPVASTRS